MSVNKIDNTIIDTFKELYKPETMKLSNGREVVVIPAGIKIESTKKYNDEYLTAPERRKGIAKVGDIESFIAHVNRFKDVDSALFANNSPQNPGLTAVLDYHKQTAIGEPRFGEHRTHYSFPLSKEWKTWTESDGAKLSQGDFAAFIEDNILDCSIDEGGSERITALKSLLGGSFASPQKLVELSRGLTVNETSKVRGVTNLSTGETSIVYETEHQDTQGAPIQVPNMFLITIPVFEGGDRYRIAVRLRYRKSSSITWFYELSQVEEVFNDAIKGACEKAKTETALPLFVGAPE